MSDYCDLHQENGKPCRWCAIPEPGAIAHSIPEDKSPPVEAREGREGGGLDLANAMDELEDASKRCVMNQTEGSLHYSPASQDLDAIAIARRKIMALVTGSAPTPPAALAQMREALKDAAERGFNMGMTYVLEKRPDGWPAEIQEKIVGWVLQAHPALLAPPVEPEANRTKEQIVIDLDDIDECLDLLSGRICHELDVEPGRGCCFGHDTLADAREAMARLYATVTPTLPPALPKDEKGGGTP